MKFYISMYSSSNCSCSSSYASACQTLLLPPEFFSNYIFRRHKAKSFNEIVVVVVVVFIYRS